MRKNLPSDLRLSFCRDPEVSRSTVPVANHPEIRAILVQQQRAMAHACRYAVSAALFADNFTPVASVIMDGRDATPPPAK